MKLSINQGPFVGGSNIGFVISVDHCQEISTRLFKWYKTIPEQVAKHIEIIHVGPSRAPAGEFVCIKIICSGGGEIPWKRQAELDFLNLSTEKSIFLPKLELQLSWKLDKVFRLEKESRESSVSHLSDLVDLMKKVEKAIM